MDRNGQLGVVILDIIFVGRRLGYVYVRCVNPLGTAVTSHFAVLGSGRSDGRRGYIATDPAMNMIKSMRDTC